MNKEDRSGRSRSFWSRVTGSLFFWPFLGFVLSAFLVFYLPWQIQPAQQVKGLSYSLGFSNRSALLGLGVCLLSVSGSLLFRGPSIAGLAWLEISPVLLPAYRDARREYNVLILFSALAFVSVMGWNWYILTPSWGESAYFLSRMDLIALGLEPYRNFQFNYGPAMLYAPFWMEKGIPGNIGFENAYALCVAFGFPAGFFALFLFLRTLVIRQEDRPWILAFFLLPWCCLSMGLQYVPLRFSLLPACLVVGHAMVTKGGWIRSASAVFAGGLSCFMVSPEMGIACVSGFTGYSLVCLLSRRREALPVFVGAMCSVVCMFWVASGYLHGLVSFASGANNFPVYPNLHNCVAIASCLFILPVLAVSAWSKLSDPRSPLAAGLGSAAAMLLPAAFGRADPGHVMGNILIVLGLLFGAFAALGRPVLRLWTAVYVLVFIALFQLSYWAHYIPHYRLAIADRHFYRNNPLVIAGWEAQWKKLLETSETGSRLHWSKVARYPGFRQDVSGLGRVAMPLGTNEGVDRFMKTQKTFSTTYHPSLVPEILSPADLERTLRESLASDFILVPEQALNKPALQWKSEDNQKATQDMLSLLMLYPVTTVMRNEPFLADERIVQSLSKTTRQVWLDDGYVLLQPLR